MSLIVPRGSSVRTPPPPLKTPTYNLESDDFISRTHVRAQLDELQDYISARRVDEPAFNIPRPLGWKMSVLMLTFPRVTDGGIELVDDLRVTRAMGSPQGVVIGEGQATYTDPDRFDIKGEIVPWCKRGDRLLWLKYDIATFQLANKQIIGFITDTQPVALIDTGWETPEYA